MAIAQTQGSLLSFIGMQVPDVGMIAPATKHNTSHAQHKSFHTQFRFML